MITHEFLGSQDQHITSQSRLLKVEIYCICLSESNQCFISGSIIWDVFSSFAKVVLFTVLNGWLRMLTGDGLSSMFSYFEQMGSDFKYLDSVVEHLSNNMQYYGTGGATFAEGLRCFLRFVIACVVSLENIANETKDGMYGIIDSYLATQSLYYYTKNLSDLCSTWFESQQASKKAEMPSSHAPISALLSLLYEFGQLCDTVDEEQSFDGSTSKHSVFKHIILQLLDRGARSYLQILDQWLGFSYKGADGHAFDRFKEAISLSDLPHGAYELSDKQYCEALLPSFIPRELASKIVESGLFLRFLSELSPENNLPRLLRDDDFGLKLSIGTDSIKSFNIELEKHIDKVQANIRSNDLLRSEENIKRKLEEEQMKAEKVAKYEKLLQERDDLLNEKRRVESEKKLAWGKEVESFLAQRKEYINLQNQQPEDTVNEARESLIEEEKKRMMEEYSAKLSKTALQLERVQWAIERHRLSDKRKALWDREREDPATFWSMAEIVSQVVETGVYTVDAVSPSNEVAPSSNEQIQIQEEEKSFAAESSMISTDTFQTAPDEASVKSFSQDTESNIPVAGVSALPVIQEDLGQQCEEKLNESEAKMMPIVGEGSEIQGDENGTISKSEPLSASPKIPSNDQLPTGSKAKISLDLTLTKETTLGSDKLSSRSISHTSWLQLEKALIMRCDMISIEALRVFLLDFKLQEFIQELGSKFLMQDGLFVSASVDNILNSISSVADENFYQRDRLLYPFQVDLSKDLNVQLRRIISVAIDIPPILKMIISDKMISSYKKIFSRLIKLKYISIFLDKFFIKEIFYKDRHRSRTNNPTATKLAMHFKFEAQTFIRENISYIFNFGIRGPWDMFVKDISEIASNVEEKSESSVSASSIVDLETFFKAHTHTLERIERRLFIEDKQHAVLRILEDIEHQIIQFVILYVNNHDQQQQLEAFEKFQESSKLLGKVIKRIKAHVDQENHSVEDKNRLDDLLSYSILLDSLL
ncbi:hypothetical protein HDV05_008329 [Chytridiales sp. JEL 0842]|nr:hypothetical protein HDV05_008329 [Chytridiales sp. JEL 0842]